MYSEQDLASAVSAGVLSEEAAMALRQYVAHTQATRPADEEQFRLISGFNDIFVSVAAAIMLGALGWIGQEIWTPLGGILVATGAWGLAEYFTRIRRMALPSILLLFAFVGGVGFAIFTALYSPEIQTRGTPADQLIAAGIALAVAIAAWLHWRRFMVPITIAAGTAAIAGTIIALIMAAIGVETIAENGYMALILIAGIAVFVFAMWWDGSDRARATRRSDVAFWLHMLAAPMIAHPLFSLLGISTGLTLGIGSAVIVLALYLLFAIVALVIDRRALLVSALAYVLYALTSLFDQFGVVEFGMALTALVIGSGLLLLSAFWQRARAALLQHIPGGLQDRVPLAA